MAIERTLDQELQVIEKRRTKGLFNVETATNAGKWMIDRNWKQKANTLYKSMENRREDFEMKLLMKKKQQKRVQYMALEDQYKLHVKKK